MDRQFNLVEVLEATLKWYKPIVIISLIVLIGSFIITYPKLNIIPPKYESVTTFFPANLALSDRPYLFDGEEAVDVELELFGDKHDVDRLVSIARSGQVMVKIIEKFNLIEHYKIDKEKEKYPLSTALSKFKKNYEAFKNEYEGVEIHVIDKDNVKAAEMANEAVKLVNEINKNMVLEGRNRMLHILEKHIATKEAEMKELLAKQSVETTPEKKKMLEFNQHIVSDQLYKYANLKDQYELISSEDISTLHVMEEAYPAEKDYTKRLVMVIGAFLATFFLLVMVATVVHVLSK